METNSWTKKIAKATKGVIQIGLQVGLAGAMIGTLMQEIQRIEAHNVMQTLVNWSAMSESVPFRYNELMHVEGYSIRSNISLDGTATTQQGILIEAGNLGVDGNGVAISVVPNSLFDSGAEQMAPTTDTVVLRITTDDHDMQVSGEPRSTYFLKEPNKTRTIDIELMRNGRYTLNAPVHMLAGLQDGQYIHMQIVAIEQENK